METYPYGMLLLRSNTSRPRDVFRGETDRERHRPEPVDVQRFLLAVSSRSPWLRPAVPAVVFALGCTHTPQNHREA